MVSAIWRWLQARGWMEHGAWKVVDSFNEMHIFMLVKTGITTGNSRDIFNTTCDALSSWSLDPMLSGAVWLKINLEKLVCTVVSWPMFQVTVALPSGYSEKFSVEQSSTVGDLRRLDTCPPDTWYELHPSVALLRWPRQRWLHCDCVNMGRPVCKSVCV